MENNENTVYLAGKITGDPDYKEKFERARLELEGAGFFVLDPSVLPAKGFEYETYMRIAKAMLIECEAVCFLPDWKDSGGAQREHRLAGAVGKDVFYFDEWRKSHGFHSKKTDS